MRQRWHARADSRQRAVGATAVAARHAHARAGRRHRVLWFRQPESLRLAPKAQRGAASLARGSLRPGCESCGGRAWLTRQTPAPLLVSCGVRASQTGAKLRRPRVRPSCGRTTGTMTPSVTTSRRSCGPRSRLAPRSEVGSKPPVISCKLCTVHTHLVVRTSLALSRQAY